MTFGQKNPRQIDGKLRLFFHFHLHTRRKIQDIELQGGNVAEFRILCRGFPQSKAFPLSILASFISIFPPKNNAAQNCAAL